MTTPNKLIEEVVKEIAQQEWLLSGDVPIAQDWLRTVLTKHEDAVLEREARALEGKMKMYETATPMNPDYDDAYNTALQQAADHLRNVPSNKI